MSPDLQAVLSIVAMLMSSTFVSLAIRSTGKKYAILMIAMATCLTTALLLLPFTHEPSLWIQICFSLVVAASAILLLRPRDGKAYLTKA